MRSFLLAVLCAAAVVVAAPNFVCEEALEVQPDGSRMPYSLNGAPVTPAGTLTWHTGNEDLSNEDLSILYFTFTAESTGMLTVESCDANYHVGMSVYEGAPEDVCVDGDNGPVTVLSWEDDSDTGIDFQALTADTEVSTDEGLHCGHAGRGFVAHFDASAGQQYTVLLFNFEMYTKDIDDLSATTSGGGAELGNQNIGNGLGWGSLAVRPFSDRREAAPNAQCVDAEIVSVPSEWTVDFSLGSVSSNWDNDDEEELNLWYLIETGTQNGYLEGWFSAGGNVEVTLFPVGGQLDAPLNEADLLVACAIADTDDGGTTQNQDYYQPHQALDTSLEDDDGGEYVFTGNFDGDTSIFFESNSYYLMRVGWDVNWDYDDETLDSDDDGSDFPQFMRQAIPGLTGHIELVGLWEGPDSSVLPYDQPDNQSCLSAQTVEFGRTYELDYSGNTCGTEDIDWNNGVDDGDDCFQFYEIEVPANQPFAIDICDTDFEIGDIFFACRDNDDDDQLVELCIENDFDYATDDAGVDTITCGPGDMGEILIFDNGLPDDYDSCVFWVSMEAQIDDDDFYLGKHAKARMSIVGPPVGDNCFRPISIDVGESKPFTLLNASPAPYNEDEDEEFDYESLQCNSGGATQDDDEYSRPDVWFEFTAPSDGVYTFDTCNNFPNSDDSDAVIAIGVYPNIAEVCNDDYDRPVPCSGIQDGFGYEPISTDDGDDSYGMCGRHGDNDPSNSGTGVTLALGERQSVLIQVFSDDFDDDDGDFDQEIFGVDQNFLTVTQEASTSTVGCASYGADDVQVFCGAGVPAGCRADHNPLSGAGGGCACFCDATCVEFGDCCADYCSSCATASTEHLEACGLAVGDPHVRGYHGEQFEVLGTANAVYNLLTDANVHVNALFEPSCMSSSKRTANIMSEVGLRFGEHRMHWVAETRTATLDGKTMRAEDGVHALSKLDEDDLAHVSIAADGRLTFESSDYSVTVVGRRNRCGQWVTDLSVEFRSKLAMPHGLLGQTETPQGERQVGRVPGAGFSHHQGDGYIEGTVRDYRVHGEDLFGTEFRFNRFGEERRVRQLDERDAGNRSRAAPGLERAHVRAALKEALKNH